MAAHSPPPPAPPAGPAATVFWAEDAFDDQFMIREVARGIRPRHAITFFNDGQALLDALRDETPELIVLDIRMPRLDGVATLKAIRKQPAFAQIPVIMFSTAKLDAEVAACEKLGVQAFLQKPARFEDFSQAVRSIVDGTAAEAYVLSGQATT
jgi:CheY-like chemotaxis protein